MDLGLEGKSALVTGSSRGIGRAIALALAAEGCRVAFSSRGGPDLDEAVAAARARGATAIGVTGDLMTATGVETIARAAVEALGGVDILVNNVGGSGARAWDQLDEGDLRAVLDKNLWPAYRMSQAILPQMRARGAGTIVMIAPEEIGDVVAFLCSPRARWVAGACVVVDGGQSRAF